MRTKLLMAMLFLYSYSALAQAEWPVPNEANSNQSPFNLTAEKVVAKGEKIFGKICWTCHGEEGTGDGVAGEALDPKPADLTSSKVHEQTDGALFWKISNGRGNMAGYEHMLSDEQRWQLVAFIRSLVKDSRE